MAKRVVLYTSPGVGHVVPMLELANLFLRPSVGHFSVTLAFPHRCDALLPDVVARAPSTHPEISVHVLPVVSPGDTANESQHPVLAMLDSLRCANQLLLDFLAPIADSVAALVLDLFCVDALDVAEKLRIPAYVFYPSSAGDLAVYFHIPYFLSTTPLSFKDMGRAMLRFPGAPLISAADMPETFADRTAEVTSRRFEQLARMADADGFLVNSFEELESTAVQALRDGVCIPGRPTPPVYCVGPLIAGSDDGPKNECLRWLDSQPKQSVVFLCFGSLGAFTSEQIREIAVGLESSGRRFLWALKSWRKPGTKWPQLQAVLDPEELLPEGFMERTKGRGLVATTWVPQAAILRHEAVGCFVTHCGWNSSLEAVAAGVPVICWPLYAEQRLNKTFLVEAARVGVEMKGYDEELVGASEVEAQIRRLMDSDEGRELRERLQKFKECARVARTDGGSSAAAFRQFLADAAEKCNKKSH